MKNIIVIVIALGLIGVFMRRHHSTEKLPAKAQLLCDLWRMVEHPRDRQSADEDEANDTAPPGQSHRLQP